MTASVSPAGRGPGTPAVGTPAYGGSGLDAPAIPGYDSRRTLPLRVEFIRQLRRRRTMVAFLILLVLPWVLVGAFELGGPAQPGNGPPGLVDLATDGGLNFAAFSFFASAGFLLVVAGLAFLLSVSTDSPLGAVGGAVGLVIVSSILDQVTALGSWREILPTHWQYAWLDAFSAQLSWGGMVEGAAVSVSYALVLFALAFRHFRTKDIVS